METAISLYAAENVLAKTDSQHVMALFNANDNILHIQINDAEGRKNLEDKPGAEPGSYWACLTRKSLGNFIVLHRIPLGVDVTLFFRTEGGSFKRAAF